MKHILARAPAFAALFIVACAGSQKNLTEPQKAAMKAEEAAQDAQNDAQKARQEASKTQAELYEAQTTHVDARQAEIQANQRAQQASYEAGRAEQQAGMASRQQQAQMNQQQFGQQPKGVTEAQAPAPVVKETTKVVVITSGLLFPSNSAELSSSSKPKLDEVVSALRQNPQGNNVIVEGFTDDTGSAEANQKLSQERAQSVADYLQSQGVPKDKVQTKAMGAQQPVGSDKTAEGRALNRRVDILVQPIQGQTNMQGQDKNQQGNQGNKGQPQAPKPQSP